MPRERGKRPPLEARTNWGPWLPATEGSPDVGATLHSLALVVLAVALFVLVAMFVMVASAW